MLNLALVALAVLAVAEAPASPPRTIYLRAGKLLDVRRGVLLSDMVVAIKGDRVSAVAKASDLNIPAGAEVIDLSKSTVLPGLIDCHVHLSSRTDRPDRFAEIWEFKDTPFDDAFAAVKNAQKTLEAGFTTVRDVGSRPFLAVDLKKRIDEGFLVGPRVVASGPPLSMTGGHGDINGFSPQTRQWMFREERDFSIADGADQVRQTVRAQMKYGVDLIKIHATGGVFSRGDQPGAAAYSIEELRVAVEEAHKGGRKIAAHAHGAQGIKNALIAGVDSIEHASLIDDEGIKLAKEKGTALVMDIYNDDYILQEGPRLQLQPENLEKERKIGQLQRDNFARAFKAGARMVFGTDAGVYPHGDNARQFAFMVKYGMTAAQAIRSATLDAAELLGRDDVGAIEAGRFADLIAVDGNPLANVRLLEHVQVVMKGGVVYKDAHTQ